MYDCLSSTDVPKQIAYELHISRVHKEQKGSFLSLLPVQGNQRQSEISTEIIADWSIM